MNHDVYTWRTDNLSICTDCKWKSGYLSCLLNLVKTTSEPQSCNYYESKCREEKK